jgi:hypothetical protein
MSGYNLLLKIRRVEADADSLGLMLCHSKHGWDQNDPDTVAVRPKGPEDLPIYSRDAELFSGTIEQLEIWLRGVEWARNYDMMLRLSDDNKRERKEQDIRNQNLIRRLKNEKVLADEGST